MTSDPAASLADRSAALQALDVLGDVAALIDARTGIVQDATQGWMRCVAQPPARTGSDAGPHALPAPGEPVDEQACALQGWGALLSRALACGRHGVENGGRGNADGDAQAGHDGDIAPAPGPVSTALGARRQWQASAASHADGTVLLRLVDRQAQGLAIQRQLDDRERLLFTSRVISVGEMATTLAHEINQPIGAAGNLLRGLRTRLQRRSGALHPDEAAALDRAVDQLMFASRVVARIREFTHSREPRQQTVDLARLLHDSAALLDWDLDRSGVALDISVPAHACPVRGDEVMLQQVLVNLMRNAIDAMRQHPPAQPRLHLSVAVRDGQVEAAVRDNGVGMDADAEQRLFVPFASTKPHGMGIGLSICRSFVELHQGRLWFSRNPERGCTFHLGLPLAAAAAT